MRKGTKIFLRLELALVAVAFLAVWLFSMEPARDFFIESTLERHYGELEQFRKATQTLRAKRLTAQELNSVRDTMIDLSRKGFILEEDGRLLQSQVLERLGDTRGAETMLRDLLRSDDPIVRADAVMRLVSVEDHRNEPEKGAKLIENNRDLFRNYRRDESLFTLARMYWQSGDFVRAGHAAASIVHLSDDEDDRDFYRQTVKARWCDFSHDERRRVLDTLIDISYFGTAAELTASFIRENAPGAAEAERVAFSLLSRSRDGFTQPVLDSLSANTNLAQVAQEMSDYCTSAAPDIRSRSGVVRGAYYNRLLRNLNRGGRYNAEAAMKRFRDYLTGDVDQEYLRKDLLLALRAQLAVKDYASATNLAWMAFARAGRTNQPAALGYEAAFWSGYAAWRLSDGPRALQAFEASLSLRPVGYHAMQAHEMVFDLFAKKMVPGIAPDLGGYVRSLEEKFLLGQDVSSRIYYGRALYAFRTGAEREALGERIAGLLRDYRASDLFDFDSAVLSRLRSSPGYIKFLIYARAGFQDRAKALLASGGIQDPLIQDILLLREMVKNRQYQKAEDLFSSLELSDDLMDVLPFLSPELQRCIFPTPFDGEISLALSKLRDGRVDRLLVYSIIRAESFYQPNLRSSAGARGLMQLMPSTARLISKDVLGQREVNLYDPVNNILLGTRFLNDNVQDLGLVSGVACYNGGNAVVSRIQRRFSPANPAELVEILPYAETREYVTKVLTYYAYYSLIYQQENLSAKVVAFAR
jgi:hypothetical protein